MLNPETRLPRFEADPIAFLNDLTDGKFGPIFQYWHHNPLLGIVRGDDQPLSRNVTLVTEFADLGPYFNFAQLQDRVTVALSQGAADSPNSETILRVEPNNPNRITFTHSLHYANCRQKPVLSPRLTWRRPLLSVLSAQVSTNGGGKPDWIRVILNQDAIQTTLSIQLPNESPTPMEPFPLLVMKRNNWKNTVQHPPDQKGQLTKLLAKLERKQDRFQSAMTLLSLAIPGPLSADDG